MIDSQIETAVSVARGDLCVVDARGQVEHRPSGDAAGDRVEVRFGVVDDGIAVSHVDGRGDLFVAADAGGAVLVAPVLRTLHAAGVALRPDPYAIAHVLAFGTPPRATSMWRDVHRLRPGEALVMRGHGRVRRIAAAGVTEAEPLDVAGRRVAVLGDRGDARARWLGWASRRAGAAEVTFLVTPVGGNVGDFVAESRRSAVAALEPFGVAAWRLGGWVPDDAEADVVVSPAAMTGAAARHERLRRRVALHEKVGGAASKVDRGLIRDTYFDWICVFSDEDRFAFSGERMLATNCLSAADHLGLALEEADAAGIVAACRRIDHDLFVAGGLLPALQARAAAQGITLIVPRRARPGRSVERVPVLSDGSAARALLGEDAQLVSEGYLRAGPFLRIVEESFADLAGAGGLRLLTLLDLEIWLRETAEIRR